MAKRKIGYFCYNTFLALAALILSPIILFRILAYYKLRFNFHKDFSKNIKPVIWVHAVSEQQLIAAENVLHGLRTILSDYQPVVTYTGWNMEKAVQTVKSKYLFKILPYPIEFCFKTIVSRIKPCLFIVFEDCFYPNQIRFCKAAGSKVALINGRVNNKLSLIFRLAPNFLKSTFEQIDLLMMGTVAEANRIGQMGAHLSAIMVSDVISYQDELNDEVELNGNNIVNKGICTIGTLLGRNL